MNALIAALLSGLSQAALFIIAKFVTKEFFVDILERLIIAGVDYLDDKTASPMIADIAVIVKARLRDQSKG